MSEDDKVICPNCNTQTTEPQQSYCDSCGCFITYVRFERLFEKLKEAAPDFSARAKVGSKKGKKSKELVERLKARKRFLGGLLPSQKISEKQLTELAHIDEQIKKFDPFHRFMEDMEGGASDFDLDIDVSPKAVIGSIAEFFDKLKKEGPEAAIGGALKHLSDNMPDDKKTISGAEKIREETREHIEEEDAIREEVRNEVDKLIDEKGFLYEQQKKWPDDEKIKSRLAEVSNRIEKLEIKLKSI